MISDAERQLDRAFYLVEYALWVNERHAHLLLHEGRWANTMPGGAPAGKNCARCVEIDRMCDHWASRLSEEEEHGARLPGGE